MIKQLLESKTSALEFDLLSKDIRLKKGGILLLRKRSIDVILNAVLEVFNSALNEDGLNIRITTLLASINNQAEIIQFVTGDAVDGPFSLCYRRVLLINEDLHCGNDQRTTYILT